MGKVQLTYKFRLYPKKEQEERLIETLEIPASLIVEAGSPSLSEGVVHNRFPSS